MSERTIDVSLGAVKPVRRRVVVSACLSAFAIKKHLPDIDITNARKAAEAFGKWHFGERFIAVIIGSDVWANPRWIEHEDGIYLKTAFAVWEK